ncbi:MAG: phenylalanyl-tRNA synthetase alpha chain [Actinomycetota bacterium]|jgi:phenylalanyl-tRNA synthetase alpha chain|nr:phenylalanyl-tRNA synthetase alpha chain [Actinomycetota bacterium]
MTTANDLAVRAETTARAGADAFAAAGTLEALEEAERRFLGKSSPLNEIREAIKSVDGSERAVVGKAVSGARADLEATYAARREILDGEAAALSATRDRLDLTLGPREYQRGHMHPVTRIWRELEDVFVGLGYKVAEGPEVETDWYNFESLNFPPGHPARAMQDTLYVRLGERESVMLRTHTSPVQVRTMESQPPPIYVVAPGRAFRRDTLDARHSPVFHQIEGLAVDEGITLGDLLGTIEAFIHALFGSDIKARFLPSFFPFTEPSVEFAMSCVFCRGEGCTVCSRTGWVELGGAGMVDPNVFQAVGIDPEKYTGFAFGFGIDRLVQLLYGVDHIKNLWDGDVRFARQF